MTNLLSRQSQEVERIAAELRRRDIEYVFLAARGTSDNAGRYANYLWGAHNGLPLALATPSLFTYYNQPPLLKNALVVGVSQSGQSPDIVSVLAEGRRRGCATLAITNDAHSPLAAEADYVIDILAGEEKAVAATKTYTAQLMAIAMLSTALAQDPQRRAELERVPAWATQVLRLDSDIQRIAQRYRFVRQCVVLGRGFNYSTAFEFSLKLKELTYTLAEPYSSADFMHGPIAMLEQGFPVMAIAPDGAVFDALLEVLRKVRLDQSADLLVISDRPEALELAHSGVQLPEGMPEWITPLVSILPAQLFCMHLTITKGFNPDVPRTIRKVTETI
ncbi:MAG: SIS domain-containing protein [Anaerolineae bacterium]|nr:SIS domain-containing protein [Anaerolineae bacterium]